LTAGDAGKIAPNAVQLERARASVALSSKTESDLEVIITVVTAYACLRYKDADAALEFLGAAFGFEAVEVHRGATGRIEHALVRAGESLVMLGEHRGPGPYARMVGRGWTYVAVPEVDSLYARAQAAGAQITMELTDQPHGSRDFSALDLDGNQWNFGTYAP
jgi:uncharacterized glyoxalase superfamily protein PhnB